MLKIGSASKGQCFAGTKKEFEENKKEHFIEKGVRMGWGVGKKRMRTVLMPCFGMCMTACPASVTSFFLGGQASMIQSQAAHPAFAQKASRSYHQVAALRGVRCNEPR